VNLGINLEDIEIDPCHHTAKHRDMTLPTEESNQEKDQDQEVIQVLEIMKAQEKLEQMRTKIIMDLKSEMSHGVEAVDHIEEEDIVIKEEDKITRIETNQIKKDTKKHRNIIHIRNRPSTRLKTR
jgi:hypothetical protein